MRTPLFTRAMAQLPSDDDLTVDLVRRYAKHMQRANGLEREAKKAATSVERVNLLREARGQTQTALKFLREASEHAHRSARVGSRVGKAMPPWLKAAEGDDEKAAH